jgi:hypothetical protein
MSDWITFAARANVTTVKQRESIYSAKEVKKARDAQEFLRNSGYPSEKEAAHLISDGNITGVPHMAQDIHRAFDIYGRSPAAVRGKMTKQHVDHQQADWTLKEQRTEQVLYSDIMKVRGEAYLVSVSVPLELVIVSNVVRENENYVGKAIQSQLSLLRSRGFMQCGSACEIYWYEDKLSQGVFDRFW